MLYFVGIGRLGDDDDDAGDEATSPRRGRWWSSLPVGIALVLLAVFFVEISSPWFYTTLALAGGGVMGTALSRISSNNL